MRQKNKIKVSRMSASSIVGFASVDPDSSVTPQSLHCPHAKGWKRNYSFSSGCFQSSVVQAVLVFGTVLFFFNMNKCIYPICHVLCINSICRYESDDDNKYLSAFFM